MRFVDSHLHVGEGGASDELAESACTDTLLVLCGTDQKTSLEGMELARLRPELLRAFVGVHPSEAGGSTDLGWLDRVLGSAAGIGEVGLDPTYSDSGPGSAQMKLFTAQAELAQKWVKPLQVHSREAGKEAIDILDGFRVRGVLMHWFEDEGLLRAALSKGYFVSFGPAILYSKKLQRMAARTPPDQALTETDSPVAYGPIRGAHGPSLVPSVVFKLAQVWGVGFEEARASTVSSAGRFLGLPSKG